MYPRSYHTSDQRQGSTRGLLNGEETLGAHSLCIRGPKDYLKYKQWNWQRIKKSLFPRSCHTSNQRWRLTRVHCYQGSSKISIKEKKLISPILLSDDRTAGGPGAGLPPIPQWWWRRRSLNASARRPTSRILYSLTYLETGDLGKLTMRNSFTDISSLHTPN